MKEMKHRKPSYKLETQYLQNNTEFVFGMDEVGRGSFAGPLIASAVCFKKKFKWFKKINDSKLLTHKQRAYLSKLVKKHSIHFIELIDVETINKIGIEKSNILIFKRLIKQIESEYVKKSIHYLIDGRKKKIANKNPTFLIKGESISVSIAAASIVAKVYRDKLMRDLGKKYKGYNFYRNKGYGTKFHREAIKKRGLTNIHRTSFNLRKFL